MRLCSIFNVPTTHTLCTPFVRVRTFSLSASSKIATLGRGIKLPGMMGAGGGGKVKKKEGKHTPDKFVPMLLTHAVCTPAIGRYYGILVVLGSLAGTKVCSVGCVPPLLPK